MLIIYYIHNSLSILSKLFSVKSFFKEIIFWRTFTLVKPENTVNGQCLKGNNCFSEQNSQTLAHREAMQVIKEHLHRAS